MSLKIRPNNAHQCTYRRLNTIINVSPLLLLLVHFLQMIDRLLLLRPGSDSLVPHSEPCRVNLEHLRPLLLVNPHNGDDHTERSHAHSLGGQLAELSVLLDQDVDGDPVAVLELEFGCLHLQTGDDVLGVDHVAGHNCAYLVSDVEDVGHRFRNYELVLGSWGLTSTFFWVQTTTESLPLMATVVIPSFLTALRAFSGVMGRTDLVETAIWREDRHEFVSLHIYN